MHDGQTTGSDSNSVCSLKVPRHQQISHILSYDLCPINSNCHNETTEVKLRKWCEGAGEGLAGV